jgi:hypothetical protein
MRIEHLRDRIYSTPAGVQHWARLLVEIYRLPHQQLWKLDTPGTEFTYTNPSPADRLAVDYVVQHSPFSSSLAIRAAYVAWLKALPLDEYADVPSTVGRLKLRGATNREIALVLDLPLTRVRNAWVSAQKRRRFHKRRMPVHSTKAEVIAALLALKEGRELCIDDSVWCRFIDDTIEGHSEAGEPAIGDEFKVSPGGPVHLDSDCYWVSRDELDAEFDDHQLYELIPF